MWWPRSCSWRSLLNWTVWPRCRSGRVGSKPSLISQRLAARRAWSASSALDQQLVGAAVEDGELVVDVEGHGDCCVMRAVGRPLSASRCVGGAWRKRLLESRPCAVTPLEPMIAHKLRDSSATAPARPPRAVARHRSTPGQWLAVARARACPASPRSASRRTRRSRPVPTQRDRARRCRCPRSPSIADAERRLLARRARPARRHDRQRARARSASTIPRRSTFLRTDPAARPLYQLRPGQAAAASRPTTTAGSLALRFVAGDGELLSIARDGDALRRRDARRRRRTCAWKMARRRDPLVAVRRRRRGRAAGCGHAAAGRRLRRRHRFLSRPAPRRPLHRRLRDALRRRRAGRRRPHRRRRVREPRRDAVARSCGAAPTAARATTREDGAQRCARRSCARRWSSRASRPASRMARFHPILQTWRAHKGVDFAAPIGHAGARDRRRRRSRSPASRTATATSSMLQHGGAFSTLYAHLSRFAPRPAHRRARARRATSIGYVGQTGWATGPHLHYEFRVAGEQRNPLTVALPDGAAARARRSARRSPRRIAPPPRSSRSRGRCPARSVAAARIAARADRRHAPRALRRRDVRHEPRRRRRRARRFRAGDGAPARLLGAAHVAVPDGAARRAARAADAAATTSSRAPARAANALADLYADAIAAALADAGVAARRRRRRRRARPDAAAPAGRRLDAAAQQSGARRRARRHDRRRRFPQPRRRGGRAGRAAGAGVPRGAVRRRRRASRRSSTSAASPTSPTCRRTAPCAASTPARATCCSTCGACAHRGDAFDRDGAWAATGTVDRRAARRAARRAVLSRAAAEEHRAATSSTADWLDARLARRSAIGAPPTCRRRSSR